MEIVAVVDMKREMSHFKLSGVEEYDVTSGGVDTTRIWLIGIVSLVSRGEGKRGMLSTDGVQIEIQMVVTYRCVCQLWAIRVLHDNFCRTHASMRWRPVPNLSPRSLS